MDTNRSSHTFMKSFYKSGRMLCLLQGKNVLSILAVFHPQKLRISADAKTHNQCSQCAVVIYPQNFVFSIIVSFMTTLKITDLKDIYSVGSRNKEYFYIVNWSIWLLNASKNLYSLASCPTTQYSKFYTIQAQGFTAIVNKTLRTPACVLYYILFIPHICDPEFSTSTI